MRLSSTLGRRIGGELTATREGLLAPPSFHYTLQTAANLAAPNGRRWSPIPGQGHILLHQPRRNQPQPPLPGGEIVRWGTKRHV